MYSCGPLHMVEQRLDVQLKPTYTSSAPILDVALRTCQKQWAIGRGGERGSEISVLIVRDDDGDIILSSMLKIHFYWTRMLKQNMFMFKKCLTSYQILVYFLLNRKWSANSINFARGSISIYLSIYIYIYIYIRGGVGISATRTRHDQ